MPSDPAKKNSRAEAAAILRRKAMAVQAAHPSTEAKDETLHELQVHQIELEMQNDELHQIQSVVDSTKKRYFELYDQAPVGYCTLAENSVIEEANLKAGDLFGVAPADLVGQNVTRFVLREDQDVYYLARKKLFESAKPQTFPLRMLCRGTTFWAQLSTTLTQGTDGASMCRLVVEDISRQKAAEEALTAEKSRLDITLRSIADGVITIDSNGSVVLMNPAAERLSGWGLAEAKGKPLPSIVSFIDDMTRQPRENMALRVLASGVAEEESEDVLLQSRVGNLHNITGSASPIKDAGGSIQGVVFAFHDMTEQVKMRTMVQDSDKLDSLGVLAGGIAHDFNNLLGGIFGYLSLAKESLADSGAALDYLNKAGAVFHRAKALTLQLMTFSKGPPPQRVTARLSPIIRGAATFVLTGSNIHCDFSLSDDLCLCDFDGHQMSQVFTNLILNAKQSMPLGGTIRISAHNTVLKGGEIPTLPPGVYLKISVADQGEGIPHHLFKNIFDPFFTTRKAGQGLGLPTCRSIVQKHNGVLEVQSEPGEGSVFHVYLPASTQELAPETVEPVAVRPAPGTILIMDDEEYMREIIREMLKSIGYQVIETGSGEAAFRHCSLGQDLQAAIIDLTVRDGMGGRDTLEAIRKVMPNLPIFAASGFSEDPIMARPRDFGFTGSIGKPFQKSQLAHLLAEHLSP